ncbi:MAG: RDD family protein [Lentisphaeria bacterium]|jgi:uncharacterized RDD family membrane protein YckC|nr:RDD family protein [Lentisphaeria bacterium]MDP7740933.1 RDD family protein [Lentisphaeria bacterium]
MQWYYIADGRAHGPVSSSRLLALADGAIVRPGTRIWRQGMAGWQPFKTSETVQVPPRTCSRCHGSRPDNEMLTYCDQPICGQCKSAFLQCIRDGVSLAEPPIYAGFTIRALAWFVDAVTILAFTTPLLVLLESLAPDSGDLATVILSWLVTALAGGILTAVIQMLYETWFIGRHGATPGKMACGLKIVRPDGSLLTFRRAFARYWGKVLTGMTMGAGFLLLTIDRQCRSLHDFICDTRVVRNE